METGLYALKEERNLRDVINRSVYEVGSDSPEVILSKEEKRPKVNAIRVEFEGINYLVASPDCDVLKIIPTAKLIEDQELSDKIRARVPKK